MIPKFHGEKLVDIPDEHLSEILVRTMRQIGKTETMKGTNQGPRINLQPIAKKLVVATGAKEYNILQNNGRGAHQEVDHVSCFGPCIFRRTEPRHN